MCWRTLILMLLPCSALAATLSGQVSAVPSGDRLVVATAAGPLQVRIAGVAAPESDQPFGSAARRFLEREALHREVHIETRGSDAGGETVAEVKLGQRNLAAELVSRGYAWALAEADPSGDLRRLQTQARAAHRGLWGDGTPFAPWEWRAARKRLKQLAAAQALPVTADRRRHVFYPPGCPVPAALSGEDRALFHTVSQAAEAGYKRSPDCPAP